MQDSVRKIRNSFLFPCPLVQACVLEVQIQRCAWYTIRDRYQTRSSHWPCMTWVCLLLLEKQRSISEQIWCLDRALSFACHCNLLLLFWPLSALENRLAWKEGSCESHLQQLLGKSCQVRTVPSSWCSQQSERLMVCMTGWRFQPSQLWWLQLEKQSQTHTRFICFLASAEAPLHGSGRDEIQAEQVTCG